MARYRDLFVKVRLRLWRDPTLFEVTRALDEHPRFQAWTRARLPRDAIQHLALSGVLSVWREALDFHEDAGGDDVLVPGMSLEGLDRWGFPGIGDAMAAPKVRPWAVQTDAGVILPGWLRHNGKVAIERALSADRSAGYRMRNTPSEPQSGLSSRDAVTERNTSRIRHASVTLEGEGEGEGEGEKNPPTPRKRGKAAAPPGVVLRSDFPELAALPGVPEAWEEWETFRRSKGKPLSALAARKRLGTIRAEGWDARRIRAAVDASIAGDWQGLYEPRPATNGHGFGSRPTTALERLEAIARAQNALPEPETPRDVEVIRDSA